MKFFRSNRGSSNTFPDFQEHTPCGSAWPWNIINMVLFLCHFHTRCSITEEKPIVFCFQEVGPEVASSFLEQLVAMKAKLR